VLGYLSLIIRLHSSHSIFSSFCLVVRFFFDLLPLLALKPVAGLVDALRAILAACLVRTSSMLCCLKPDLLTVLSFYLPLGSLLFRSWRRLWSALLLASLYLLVLGCRLFSLPLL